MTISPKITFAALALLLAAAGCMVPKPLKGGHAVTSPTPAGGLVQTLVQSENPSQPSKQDQETIRIRTYSLPSPLNLNRTLNLNPPAPVADEVTSLHFVPSPIPQSAIRNPHSAASPLPVPTSLLADPLSYTLVSEREESRAHSELGAAQKDTTRELGAKLASLRGIVWVGVLLFVFGLAALVWPPLKLIIGSVTTSAAIMAGGLALMILPSLIVGNELLILGGVAVAVGCWFLAHRHGHLHGLVAAAQSPTPPVADEVTSLKPAPSAPAPNITM